MRGFLGDRADLAEEKLLAAGSGGVAKSKLLEAGGRGVAKSKELPFFHWGAGVVIPAGGFVLLRRVGVVTKLYWPGF